jgi:hypothetical protein
MTMLKKCALLIPLLYPPFLYAQSEAECLSAGNIAQGSAVLMHEGQSEEYVIDILTNPLYEKGKRPAARQKVLDENNISIARFVFTMRLNATEARKEVYMKCMAGGLGYIDWKKQPAAARAR